MKYRLVGAWCWLVGHAIGAWTVNRYDYQLTHRLAVSVECWRCGRTFCATRELSMRQIVQARSPADLFHGALQGATDDIRGRYLDLPLWLRLWLKWAA